jgi:glycosyltransferase involved in cell wall biosynthesis
MNICFYSPSWPPESSSNGVVTYVGQIAPALRKLGHKVLILTPQNDALNDPDVIELQRHKSPRALMLRAMHRIAPEITHFREFTALLVHAVQDLIRTHQIDILEIEECYGWSATVSKLRRIPVVVRLHGPWFLNKRFENRTRERWEGKGIRDADFVTAPSQWVLNETRSVYNISAARSVSIPNMQDIVSSSDKWRLVDCDRQSILFVGRFDEIKGGDLVIRAFGELARNNPSLKLTFVGPDNEIGGMKMLDYVKSVLPVEINRRLTYLGALTKAEIARLRPKHFVTLSASRFEVFPYAVLEAMSYGCPIVAPAIGGIPELFALPESGRLFEAGNVDAVIEACQFFLTNPDVAERYGDTAFKTCATLFSPIKNAIRMAQYYQQIIERFRCANTSVLSR